MAARQPSLARSTRTAAAATGASVFGWLDLGMVGAPEGLRVMGRLDRLDPDGDLQENGHTRAIAGVGYRVNRYVQVLVDGEWVQYESQAGVGPDGTTAAEPPGERRGLVQVDTSF
jgi:hypothetical protein